MRSNNHAGDETVEISIKGPGEIIVRFIDRRGKTLIQESIRVSGSETVEAKREIDLFAETVSGQVSIAPVLIRQNEKQQVTFDGQDHSSFTKKRCQEIGCIQSVTEDALRGCARGLQTSAVRLPTARSPHDKTPSAEG
jgi:hypothetical protein